MVNKSRTIKPRFLFGQVPLNLDSRLAKSDSRSGQFLFGLEIYIFYTSRLSRLYFHSLLTVCGTNIRHLIINMDFFKSFQ